MRAVAEEEAPLDLNPSLLQVLDLAEQHRRVNDDPVADDAELIGVKDAGGDDVEGELAEFVDYGVAGVISGRVTGDDVGFFSQQVNDPALALVPPLAAHDNYCWHK